MERERASEIEKESEGERERESEREFVSETMRHENDDYEADDEAMKHDEVHGKTFKSSKNVGTEYLVSSMPNKHF